jgi:hypothetical protein
MASITAGLSILAGSPCLARQARMSKSAGSLTRTCCPTARPIVASRAASTAQRSRRSCRSRWSGSAFLTAAS